MKSDMKRCDSNCGLIRDTIQVFASWYCQ